MGNASSRERRREGSSDEAEVHSDLPAVSVEGSTCDEAAVLGIRRRHDGLSNERSSGLAMLRLLMQNKGVEVDAKTLSSVMQTSRSGFRAVAESASRVDVLQRRQFPFMTSENHSFLLMSNDELYACGSETNQRFLAVMLGKREVDWKKFPLPKGVALKQVIVGVNHSFLISQTGELYACGHNRYGQLGLGYKHDYPDWEWNEVPLPEGVALKQIVVGLSHSFLITESGKLYACGDNIYGQLGLGNNDDQIDWVEVPLPESVALKQIVVGVGGHSFLITESGELYACGNNYNGQLGLGDRESRLHWQNVPLPEGVTLKQIVVGGSYSFLTTESGKLYACGDNESGQLGLGNDDDQIDWVEVSLPESVALKQIVVGFTHSFLITESGKLYACGDNKSGQLGLGNKDDQIDWVEVPLPESVALKEIAVGGYDSFLISQTGELYACGPNGYGELGLGHKNTQREWAQVELPRGFSFKSFLSFGEASAAVQKYLFSGASIESMRALVSTLSEEQLLLVPYHLSDKQAADLNDLAYKALSSFSDLVGQSIFSQSDDNTLTLSSYDASENYLVLYKQSLKTQPRLEDGGASVSNPDLDPECADGFLHLAGG